MNRVTEGMTKEQRNKVLYKNVSERYGIPV